MQHSFLTFLTERDLLPLHTAQHLSRVRCFVREPIGMIAVSHGLLQGPEIDLILDRQRQTSVRFGEIAVQMGVLTTDQVSTLLRIQEARAAESICEALALAGVLNCNDAYRYLGIYLIGDDEMHSVASDAISEASSQA